METENKQESLSLEDRLNRIENLFMGANSMITLLLDLVLESHVQKEVLIRNSEIGESIENRVKEIQAIYKEKEQKDNK